MLKPTAKLCLWWIKCCPTFGILFCFSEAIFAFQQCSFSVRQHRKLSVYKNYHSCNNKYLFLSNELFYHVSGKPNRLITNHTVEKSDCHAVYSQSLHNSKNKEHESLKDLEISIWYLKIILLAKLWFESPCYEFKVAPMTTTADFEFFQISYTRLSQTRILTRLIWIYQVVITFFSLSVPQQHFICPLWHLYLQKRRLQADYSHA